MIPALKPRRRPVDPATVDACEVCPAATVVTGPFADHALKPVHADNARVITDFSSYCDLREVCPVTCSPRDVAFYLEYRHGRQKADRAAAEGNGKGGRVLGPNRVLIVISRLVVGLIDYFGVLFRSINRLF